MFRYILFDLDGTLTDPKEGICKSVQYALKHMGIEEKDIDRLEPFIGPPLVDSFIKFYGMTQEEAERAVISYRERFSAIGMYENEVYKGIPELLQKCRDHGCVVAVASSKPEVYVKKILAHFKLDPYFNVVVGSELDGRRSKKEEVVEEAIRRLKEVHGEGSLEDARQVAMVGDRCFDIEGAKAFGLTSVGVEYGYAAKGELQEAGADYIAGSVKELEAVLLGDGKTIRGGKKKSDEGKGKTDGGKKSGSKKDSGGISKDAGKTAVRGGKAGEKRNAEEVKKNVRFLCKVKESKIPGNSLLKAVYMLGPFVLYFLAYQIIELAAVILLQVKTGQRDVLGLTVGGIAPETLSVLLAMAGVSAGALALGAVYHKSDVLPYRFGGDLGLAAVLGLSMALGLNLLFGYLCEFFRVSEETYQAAGFHAGVPFGLGLLFYVLLSPLAEEMVFRWLVMGRIKRILGARIAVVVSAAFFGCYHGNLLQGIYAFLMGLLMALVYEWSGSFLHPLLMHIAANAIIFTTAYLPEQAKAVLGTPAVCIVSLLLGGGMVYLLYRGKILETA